MPRPSTSRPAPRVRHGIANTSAIAWCAGNSSPGTPPVNTTCSATPSSCASRRSVVRYGPPPTITSAAPSTRSRIAGSARMSMSWPLRGTSRDRQTITGRLAEPVPRPHLRAGGRVGREPVGVHAGRHVLQRGVRPERRGEPAPGVAADVGHHVGAVPDAAQRRSGHRQHRPADLVAVRAGDDAAGTGTAGQRRQQRQRRRGAEPDRLDVVVGDQPPHPAGHAGPGQHQRGRVTHDLVAGRPCRLVELVAALPLRRIHGQGVIAARLQQLADELVKVRLDPAAAGRKIVGNQQNPGHRGQAIRTAIAATRPAPRRGLRRGFRRPPSRCRGGRGRRPVRTGRAGATSVPVGDETAEPPRAVVGECRGRAPVSRSASDGNIAISAARCGPGRGVSGLPTKSATPSVSQRGASAAVSARAA